MLVKKVKELHGEIYSLEDKNKQLQAAITQNLEHITKYKKERDEGIKDLDKLKA